MRVLAGVLSVCLAVGSTAFAAEEKAEVKVEKTAESNAMVAKVNDQVIREKDVAAETEKRVAAQAKRMPPGWKSMGGCAAKSAIAWWI
jgi:hypothetical protein